MNQIETKLPSFNERLSMFERRATIGNQTIQNRPKKINYAINKINVNEKIEKAVADQKQKTLERRPTVSFFPGQIKGDNVQRMLNHISDIKNAKKEKEEKIKKEIHEKKVVDNSAILKRTEKIKEERKKVEEEKVNDVKKNYEDDYNNINYNYNIQSKVQTISCRTYDTQRASENIRNNEKLKAQIDNNLNKIFGAELKKKNLNFEQKYHLFDRKINNCEEKEKINLTVKIKNPKPEYEYDSKIYDEDKKLVAESEKQKGEKEIILYNNLKVDYVFSKKTSYTYEIRKTLLDGAEIKSEMDIPLNQILSAEENQNYEKEIDNFNDNEIINIGFDSNDNSEENQKEKDIQLFFETKNQEYLSNVISYSIQKENKIIYKSPFCNCSHIKQTDKIPLSLLEPEFELSFYNKNYDEQKITITTEELLNQKTKNITIELPDMEKIEIVISIEKFDKISLIKLKKDGLNIDLSIAIDFTGSNGSPDYSSSLHYIKNGFINNYEKSIRACCDILSVYNKKDEYEVFGFGANVNGEFSNCFNINFNENSKIKGVENIIKEYKNSVNRVDFSGGTYFAPVINSINSKIKSSKQNLNYNILMIISDGYVHDIDNIIDRIVESSKLPLSVIIIGVGADVTSDMKKLNGEDGKLIDSSGEGLEKDIVQYVHFNDYNENIEKLTQEVFRYIPQQIKDYFQSMD
jgi:hypothetical protein